MGTVELKSNLHQLIDGIEDTKLLESLHDILDERKNAKEGTLWNSLNVDQQGEVLEAFEESERPENLIHHSQMLIEL